MILEFEKIVNNEEEIKRAIIKLINSLFILKKTDRQIYNFITKEDVSEYLTNYFAMMGYKFAVNKNKNLAYIKNEDGKGYCFNKNESIIFLYLLYIYFEKITNDIDYIDCKDEIPTIANDIYTLLTDFNHNIRFNEFKEILFKFKKINLINIESSKDNFDINEKIFIYPSITCIASQSDITNLQNELNTIKINEKLGE